MQFIKPQGKEFSNVGESAQSTEGQSGGVNYQEGQLSWTFRTYIQRITQT